MGQREVLTVHAFSVLSCSTPRLERNNKTRLSLLGFQTPCLLTELGAGVDVGSSKTS